MGNNLNCARASKKKSRKAIATCDGINKDGTPCKAKLDEHELFCKLCGKCSNMGYFDKKPRALCRHLNEDLSYCRQCGIEIKTTSIEENIELSASEVQLQELHPKIEQKRSIITRTGILQDDWRQDDGILAPGAQMQPNEGQSDVPQPPCHGSVNFCSKCGTTWEIMRRSKFCEAIIEGGKPCKTELRDTQKFCHQCGSKQEDLLSNKCPKCRPMLQKESKISEGYGTNLPNDDTQSMKSNCEEFSKETPHEETHNDEAKNNIHQTENTNLLSDERKKEKEKENINKGDDDDGLTPDMIKVEENMMRSAAEGGVEAIKNYIDKRNAEWKNIKLHIAVTGKSGAGKSAFINKIRGVKKGQYGYTAVDVKETTDSLTPHKHPQNESLIFWDMPGVGTPDYPKKEYLEKVNFDQYEFFLILSSERFTKKDLWLAGEVAKRKKSFYFVRTKIDVDISSDKKENGEDHKDDLTLEKVRKDLIEKLGNKNLLNVSDPIPVFLIDNYSPGKFDFKKLVDNLLKQIPDEKKRDAMALTLTHMTKDVITAKKAALQKRIYVVALGSAAAGACPIPGFGALVDIKIVSDELAEYKKQFGLEESELLAKFSDMKNSEYLREVCKKYSRNVMQVAAALAIDETVESVCKLAVPFVGSILSAGISYAFCVAFLRKMLNEMTDDALQLSEEAIKMIGTAV